MTVVVLADFAFVNGGAGRIALDSAKGLARRGHDVILFTAVGPIAEDLRSVRGLTNVCLESDRTSGAIRIACAPPCTGCGTWPPRGGSASC